MSVERGSVLVRAASAPGGMQRLRAGDEIVVPLEQASAPPETAEEPERASADPSTLTPTDSSTGPSDVPRTETEAPPAMPVIMDPLEDEAGADREIGADREVGAEPERERGPDPGETPPPAPTLRDADVLRRAGRLEEAATLLAALAADPAASDRAVAAFSLGRLEIDRRGRPREAAEAFERAIALGLREPLLEDARARRVQALGRFDRQAAQAAAVEYMAHHPRGRWRGEVEQWAAAP